MYDQTFPAAQIYVLWNLSIAAWTVVMIYNTRLDVSQLIFSERAHYIFQEWADSKFDAYELQNNQIQ